MIHSFFKIAKRARLAIRALKGDFDSISDSSEERVFFGDNGGFNLRAAPLAQKTQISRLERPVAQWAKTHRPGSPTRQGLREWLALIDSRPQTFELPSLGLRDALRQSDPEGDYFINGHRLAQEQIDPTLSAEWIQGHQAWLKATQSNPVERVIDGFVFLRSDGDELLFITSLLRAPFLDWSDLSVQSWAKLCRNLPSLIFRLGSAGASEQDWIQRGWEKEDIPIAKTLIEELSRARWPMDRLFNEAEVKWLRAHFRKNGMACSGVDALVGPKTLWEILLATRESYGAGYYLIGPGLFCDPPLHLLIERIRVAYEQRAVEAAAKPASLTPSAGSPSTASRL